jgi:hypothetical protein
MGADDILVYLILLILLALGTVALTRHMYGSIKAWRQRKEKERAEIEHLRIVMKREAAELERKRAEMERKRKEDEAWERQLTEHRPTHWTWRGADARAMRSAFGLRALRGSVFKIGS